MQPTHQLKTLCKTKRGTVSVGCSGCRFHQGERREKFMFFCLGHFLPLTRGYQPSRAATPGRVLPSIHSRKAPPAVEI